MKKATILTISAIMLTTAVSSAGQHAPSESGQAVQSRTAGKKATQSFRQLVPTRKTGTATGVTGLATAADNIRKSSRTAQPARKAAAKTAALSEGLKLRGSVVSTWSFMNFPGLYYIPVSADGQFEAVPGAAIIAEYGAWDDGSGRYYMAGVQDWGMGFVIPELYVYSTDTWEDIDYIECEYSILATDNATDPSSGDVYGCYYDDDYSCLNWAKADYAAGLSHSIRALDDNERLYGVACDNSGQYYGVTADGSFVRIDKASGEFTTVGNTGLRPYYCSSATFDDKSGTFIFSYAPQTGNTSLWAIDPSTGTAELLVEYVDNDQITALETIRPEAEPLAPAAPGLSAEVPEGGMEMNYTLTMPTATFDGTDAEGELSWALLVDGAEAAAGTSSYGETVSGSVTLESKGAHTVTAYASNDAGRSPLARLTVINGAGVPKAPGGLGINNFGDGSIGLYWNAVTEAADDAYIDPAAITYTVRRNGETVAEGLTDTWFDDMLAIPDTYMKLDYEVCAVFAGNVSEAASVSTGIGAIQPPYADKFGDDKNDSGLYTTINVNDDGGYWWFSPYYSSYIYDYGSEDADDWLISPAFALRGGMTYELDYTISGNSTMYTERYAVAMGVAPTERAMVTELLAPVEITSDRSGAESVTLTVTPPSDGNYYFGWHALSDGSQFQIHLRDIRLSAPMASCSPAEVTGISLVPDSEGHLRLHGSFRTPELDISGNALSSKCTVTVTRYDINGPLAAFNDVAPGTELEFDDDNFSERGVYQYIIYCTDSDGNIGRSATASVYVGPLAPADVPEVRLVEGEVPGTALLSWTAPLTDIEGNPLNPANLTYMVYVSGEYNKAIAVLDEPTAERQATFTVCKPDEMAFATYYVEALNLGLESNGMTRSPMVPVGKAETLPYSHSFNESDRGSRLFGYIVPADFWATVTVAGAADGGVRAADGDDAYLKLNCSTQGGLIDVFTGKIDLAGAENPAVSLYHYKWSEADRNIFEVVAVDSEGNETSIGIGDHATEGREGWNYSQFPLYKVKGQCVKILVRAVFNSHEDQLFDALAVRDRHPVDLVATGLTAPARVEPAKPFSLTAGIANAGTGSIAGYSVDLLLNGETVATEYGPELQPGEQTAIEFSHTLSPLANGTLEFRARINAEGDGNESDNLSEAVAPELVTSAYPAVSDLTAQRTDAGIELRWTAPSTAGFEAKETEDFEDAEAWTEEVDGWTMIDRDGQQIGALDGAGMPDAVARRTTHAFYVFDSESDDIMFYNPDLAYLVGAHSGSKSLVALYLLNPEVDQDDWAISPLLSGEAQTLSFYARSFHPDYPDRMEVLYSTEDTTDPERFVTLCPDGDFEVPQLVDAVGNAAYTRYEFELPAGALRFALRATNRGGEGFMLMIDDVSFRQAYAELEILGYDIYRDGAKINDATVTSPSYYDGSANSAAHSYNVVVNYNRGLSPASNTVAVEALGTGMTAIGTVTVTTAKGVIAVSGTGGSEVTLNSVDGRELYRGYGDCRIDVQPGVYLVTVAGATFKTAVK